MPTLPDMWTCACIPCATCGKCTCSQPVGKVLDSRYYCLCNSLPDSGKRRKFETGSQRDTRDGKGRFDLIPPLFMLLLARHFEAGGKKYEDRNWEKGQPLSVYLDSALRHIFKYVYYGAKNEDHLVAAAWNLAAMIETRERVKQGALPEALADIPIKLEKQLAHDPFEAGGL